MIYTITPNPTLDIGGVVDEVRPDDKTYVEEETRNPGGNGINVARVATRLEAEVVATGFIGGSVGDEVCELLQAEQVRHEFIRVRGKTRFGVTVTSRRNGRQTRLSFPGPEITAEEVQALGQFIVTLPPRSIVVLGGSLPPGMTSDDLIRFVHQAKEHGHGVVVDVPAKHLARVLAQSAVDLVKPNLSEFEQMAGKEFGDDPVAIARYARNYTRHARYVSVSSVGKATLLVSSERVWLAEGPPVTARSAVGAGDSLVAGMTVKLAEAWSAGQPLTAELEQAMLRLGMGAALATVETPGTMPGTAAAIHSFAERIRIESISL